MSFATHFWTFGAAGGFGAGFGALAFAFAFATGSTAIFWEPVGRLRGATAPAGAGSGAGCCSFAERIFFEALGIGLLSAAEDDHEDHDHSQDSAADQGDPHRRTGLRLLRVCLSRRQFELGSRLCFFSVGLIQTRERAAGSAG